MYVYVYIYIASYQRLRSHCRKKWPKSGFEQV